MPSRGYDSCWLPSRTLCVSEPLLLQIADVIDADDVVAFIADWFIASDVRLAQDVGLSEIASAVRNCPDGFTFRVENSAYPRDPSSVLTFVATRTNSSPFLTKIVAVPPISFWTSSTSTTLLFILVAPKCKAGRFLPASASSPLTLGAPSVAAFDFR